MDITVYLGATDGVKEVYCQAVRELGTWIGKNGHRLIYGGSKRGLMGILAEAVLKNGGKVVAVDPIFFKDLEQPEGIEQLIITPDMKERKAIMLARGDIYVAMPGGTGTLEEISEAISQSVMGLSDKTPVIFNQNGYYSGLKSLMGGMMSEGFLTQEGYEKVRFPENMDQLIEILEKEEKKIRKRMEKSKDTGKQHKKNKDKD